MSEEQLQGVSNVTEKLIDRHMETLERLYSLARFHRFLGYTACIVIGYLSGLLTVIAWRAWAF